MVRLAAVTGVLIGCGSSTGTGVSREFDDASVGAGGTRSAGAPDGGAITPRDASVPDGSAADAGACAGGPVAHVVGSRAPESTAEAGVAGIHLRPDGGFVFSLPTDPCVTYARPECPGGPRWIFGCPSVVGPDGTGVVHPGDRITVRVPVTEDGLHGYSCNGLGTDQPLLDGSSLFYAAKPAYVEQAGRIPPSTTPGTVYHFTAVASGSRYTSGTACEEDLTRIDFDLTIE